MAKPRHDFLFANTSCTVQLVKLIEVIPTRAVEFTKPTRGQDRPTLSELITQLLCIKEHL
jgi:hypothetical protein